jgi:hypothetical protein
MILSRFAVKITMLSRFVIKIQKKYWGDSILTLIAISTMISTIFAFIGIVIADNLNFTYNPEIFKNPNTCKINEISKQEFWFVLPIIKLNLTFPSESNDFILNIRFNNQNEIYDILATEMQCICYNYNDQIYIENQFGIYNYYWYQNEFYLFLIFCWSCAIICYCIDNYKCSFIDKKKI